MPVLAETAAAVSALSWRRVAGWLLGRHTPVGTLAYFIPVLPGQTAVDGGGTLSWLLTPVGMIAVPAGWPSAAPLVDRLRSTSVGSDSYGVWDLPLPFGPVGGWPGVS